jgi:hypothetical protein
MPYAQGLPGKERGSESAPVASLSADSVTSACRSRGLRWIFSSMGIRVAESVDAMTAAMKRPSTGLTPKRAIAGIAVMAAVTSTPTVASRTMVSHTGRTIAWSTDIPPRRRMYAAPTVIRT